MFTEGKHLERILAFLIIACLVFSGFPGIARAADLSELTAAIDAEFNPERTAYVLDSADYTEQSWAAYTNALSQAKNVEQDEGRTQAQIDAACAAIADKKAKLAHTVSFNSQGGSTVSSKTAVHDTKLTAPKAPTKAGKAFDGWYKESACTTAWNFANDKVTANRTLYAKWKTATQYAISAKPNNTLYGTVSGSGSYDDDKITKATVTAVPKAGYRFVRWREGSSVITTAYRYSFLVNKQRALTADFAKIGVPSISAASSAYNKITVKWKAVTGAAGYEIYRATSKSGTYKSIGTTKSTSFVSTGLTAGKQYYYKVRAKCVSGSRVTYGAFSAYKSAKPVPAMPKEFKVASVSSGIKLSWQKVAGGSKYQIYRATSSKGTYKKVAEVAALTFTDTGLKPGSQYYYKVRALRVSSKVYGSYSDVVDAKIPPKAPTKLAAKIDPYKLTLSWKAAEGAERYVVYCTTSKTGKYTKIADTDKTTYTHKSLKSGTTYYYKVRAYSNWKRANIYGKYSSVYSAKARGYYSPKIKSTLSSSSNSSLTTLSFKLKNNGKVPMKIYGFGVLYNPKYKKDAYFKDLMLVNSKGKKISSQTIQPGKTATVYFKVDGTAGKYNKYSQVIYYFKYDGRPYLGYSSNYYKDDTYYIKD